MSQVSHATVRAEEDGWRFDRWAKQHLPGLGFAQLQKLCRTGQFRVDGKRIEASARLAPGQLIRVPPLGDLPDPAAKPGRRPPREEDVVYRVQPREQRVGTVAEAVAGLRSMQAEAFAGSVVLRVHEFGEDVRSRNGFMAVPIKTRPKTPEKWQAKNPDKRLEFRPSKKFPGEGVLYEVTKTRGRGRPRKGETASAVRERFRLRFVLKRVVDMKPTLGFYRTWDELSQQRDVLWRGAADRMEKQLQELNPRDF